ncbi:MAG: hypothetical protein LBR87_07755 [Synergistaceae bacterium]|jgi:hypothetical protein|nr:hypothetical protein [Synergistaceae bacterium]
MKITGIIGSMTGAEAAGRARKAEKPAVCLTDSASVSDFQEKLEMAGANLSASDARIADVESAREIIAYTKNGILSSAALSISGQANQSQKDVIDLIQ